MWQLKQMCNDILINCLSSRKKRAEIDGEIRSIIYILDTGAWLYDNKIDVNLNEKVYCRFPYEVKSFEHTYKIIEA